jgi:hypothetical protein
MKNEELYCHKNWLAFKGLMRVYNHRRGIIKSYNPYFTDLIFVFLVQLTSYSKEKVKIPV